VTAYYVGAGSLQARLSQLRFAYLALGAAITLPQLVCLALRWRYTCRLLGAELPARQALREYALSMLLNQLLPFGVAGDAVRVARHAADGAPGVGAALRAVMVERSLGQVVVIAWAGATLPLWLGSTGLWLSGAAFGLVLLAGLLALSSRDQPATRTQRPAWLRELWLLADALGRVVRHPPALLALFALSTLIALSICVQLYCALAALGMELPLATAAQVFPLMLLSMTVPLSFAGFGPREAATAKLYAALSLSAADGAAFAVAFGGVLLCSCIPTLCVVLWLKPTALVQTEQAAQ
jgi:uncharacterized membrane protein YbhN (UPF0104 family)